MPQKIYFENKNDERIKVFREDLRVIGYLEFDTGFKVWRFHQGSYPLYMEDLQIILNYIKEQNVKI